MEEKIVDPVKETLVTDGTIGSSETTGPDSQTTPPPAWTGGAISTNKNVITPLRCPKTIDKVSLVRVIYI